MAIVGAALHAREFFEVVAARLKAAGLKSLTPKWPAVCALLCSISAAGCARDPAQRELNPPQREIKASVVRPAVRSRAPVVQVRYLEPRIRRPDLALLSPQPAPDCDFKKSDLKTMDPDQWARLKVEYERQCYLDAEKAARERLVLLQASATCEVEPVRPRTPVR